MKKILTAIAFMMCLVLPLSAMAITTISDNELSAVTGQAGVSINIDVTAHLQIGTLAWGDSNGFTGYTNMGFVGLSAMDLMVHVSGRHDGAFAIGATVGYLNNKALTIDVGTNGGGQTLVMIGIPTIHLTVDTMDTNIFVSGGALATGPTSTTAQVLGALYVDGLEVTMGQSATPTDATTFDAGYVTIGAAGAGNTGVNIGFNVAIDSVVLGTISYGNTTSLLAADFGGAATAGYIGIDGLNIDDIDIVGGVAIGVGTLNGAALGTAWGTHTQVNLVFANGTYIDIPGAIYGTILLASDKTLVTGAEELGNFYIGGVRATLLNNVGSLATHSLIQIWAH